MPVKTTLGPLFDSYMFFFIAHRMCLCAFLQNWIFQRCLLSPPGFAGGWPSDGSQQVSPHTLGDSVQRGRLQGELRHSLFTPSIVLFSSSPLHSFFFLSCTTCIRILHRKVYLIPRTLFMFSHNKLCVQKLSPLMWICFLVWALFPHLDCTRDIDFSPCCWILLMLTSRFDWWWSQRGREEVMHTYIECTKS